MPEFGSGDSGTFERLHTLVFDMLLVTDGRTTELLETMLKEKLTVSVLRQERLNEEMYIRESVLSGERSGFIVSHNIALVSSKHLPASLFESIADRQEGIGKTIGAKALPSFRKVAEYGRIDADRAVDPFGRPLRLRLPGVCSSVPFKRYFIYFGQGEQAVREPGIRMLEYYHPDIVKHRLQRDAGS